MAAQRLVLPARFGGCTQDEAPRASANAGAGRASKKQQQLKTHRRCFAAHVGLRMSVPSGGRPAMAAQTASSSSKPPQSLTVRCEKKVKLRLRLDHQVQFGETHALLGSADCTGSWQNKVPMTWTESGWVAELEGKSGEQIEFKHMIVTADGNLVWENGPNRHISLPAEGAYEIVTHWDNTQEDASFHGKLVHSGAEAEGAFSEEQEHGSGNQNGNGAAGVEEPEGDSSFSQGWQGREISFMRSNNHAKERSERWDTTGLDGPALRIVEGDKSASNWWRKLEVVRGLITSDLSKTERLEVLINAGVYLKWINTGAIACYEDGQHYRPNKHAEISRLIFRELEQINAEGSTSYKEKLVIRKIHPCLPAFKAEFTASVPLTRIRDIAHRNDIPHDVKQEIKHTIQNKLHRNAGPEDLIATEAMLKRITKTPGEYSETFVDQFKIFFKELKDFFNAGSLTEQLDGLRSSLDAQQLSVLDSFLTSKQSLDSLGSSTNGNASKSTDSLIGTMHALTSLRAALLQGLESGLQNDASDEAIAMRQKWRLSELGLEDYSFVLLSRLINALESSGGASWLTEEAKTGNVGKWNHALGAIVLGIRQLGLSGWQQGECHAIENELQAWQGAGVLETEGSEEDQIAWALRLKATLDRARRLAETYSDTLLQLFPARVEKLGNAFGILENTVRTYTEAEIRASVVFQLAKMSSMLLKAARATAGGEGYDTLMPGKVVGTLVEVDQIVPGALPPLAEGPVILLVKTADGDEEVKAAGGNVAGVILQHELPHLSHLGVRARQEKVVFVTCDDEDKVSEIRSLIGRNVLLEASSESVHIAAHEGQIKKEKEKKLVATVPAAAPSLEQSVGSESLPGKKPGSTAVLTKQWSFKESSAKSAPLPAKQSTVAKSAPGKAVELPKSAPVPAKQSVVAKSAPGSVIELAKATTETSGSKAAACGTLAILSEKSANAALTKGVSSAFEVPNGKVIPFGSMEESLKLSGSWKEFQTLLEKVETAGLEGGDLDKICNKLRELVSQQRPAKSVITGLDKGGFPSNARLIVRSSANVEDLAGMSGAGLYDSIPNVKLSEPENFGKAVAEVWASLYTRRAVLSRRVAGVPQKEAAMSILVQELLTPDLSFILHTISPIDHDEKVVQAEVAVGLGETLASGTRGSPWRLAANKFDGKVKTLSFANFSDKLVVKDDGEAADGTMVRQVVDYSTQRLSTHPEFRKQVGQRLASIGHFLEKSFGSAQDVEGCIVGTDIYIVQTRPQP